MLEFFRNPRKTDFIILRLLFILLIIGTARDLVGGMLEKNKQIVLQLKRLDQEMDTEILNNSSKIVSEKKLMIDSQNFMYNFVLENNYSFSPLLCIALIICYLCGLKILWNLNPKDFFQKDHSKPLLIASSTLFIFFFARYFTFSNFRDDMQAQHLIPSLYYLVTPFNWSLWFAIICLGWASRIFKKGYQLQKEQDLTI